MCTELSSGYEAKEERLLCECHRAGWYSGSERQFTPTEMSASDTVGAGSSGARMVLICTVREQHVSTAKVTL